MKKIKMILSIAAVLFAVAGALATTSFNNVPPIYTPVTKQLNCVQLGFCQDNSTNDCLVSGTSDVYKIRSVSAGGTTCLVNAQGTWIAEIPE